MDGLYDKWIDYNDKWIDYMINGWTAIWLQDAARLGAEVTARAKEQIEQQDDEIKKLNELILNAKCHAIRDTQLKEKEEIKTFMTEEEVYNII